MLYLCQNSLKKADCIILMNGMYIVVLAFQVQCFYCLTVAVSLSSVGRAELNRVAGGFRHSTSAGIIPLRYPPKMSTVSDTSFVLLVAAMLGALL